MNRYFFSLVLLFSVFQFSTVGQTKSDLFPLSIGNSFSYSYYSEISQFDWSAPEHVYKNATTGIATLKIVGVQIKNDTLQWSVKESDSLRLMKYTGNPSVLNSDSSYTFSDSFFVYEAISDSHKVSLSKYSGIWNLPSNFHRYASSDNYYNRQLFYFSPADYTHDTLIFKDGQGLNYRYYQSDGGFEIVQTYIFSCRLINSTILNIDSNVNAVINAFTLQQNYPNPFNPSTKISFSLADRQFVTLKIFNVLGKEITTLVNEEKSAGHHEVQWNAANIPSGIYFYELKTEKKSEIKKVVLMK